MLTGQSLSDATSDGMTVAEDPGGVGRLMIDENQGTAYPHFRGIPMKVRCLVTVVAAAVLLAGQISYAAQTPRGKTAQNATAARKPTAKKATRPLSAVQRRLQRDRVLAAEVGSRLPAGTNLMTVSSGFRSLGQFVSAVNASNSLGIPFAQLKRRMVNDGMPLGSAIQDLRPRSDYRAAASRAEDDAVRLVNRNGVAVAASR